MTQIQSYQICLLRSDEWDTVYVFPPIMPDLVLPRLYCHCPHRTSYLLPSLSSVALIIPHIFCCTHHLTSMPHLCCCYLSISMYPPPYPLPSLSAVPVVSCFCFLCTYQYYSPLIFSSTVVSIIMHLCLRHPCYLTYLPRLCYRCLHCPASLPLLSPSLRVSVSPFPPRISTHHRKVSN